MSRDKFLKYKLFPVEFDGEEYLIRRWTGAQRKQFMDFQASLNKDDEHIIEASVRLNIVVFCNSVVNDDGSFTFGSACEDDTEANIKFVDENVDYQLVEAVVAKSFEINGLTTASADEAKKN